MNEFTPEQISELKENEVFVFGSNATGFHGAGAAGVAMRGTAQNTWRQDNQFLQALNSPVDSPLKKGKWAVLGQARGFQQGHSGKSYAIETIKRPGQKRSTSLPEILTQLLELNSFAQANPNLKFLVTKIGCSLAGYSVAEISALFKQVEWSNNVVLPTEFEFRF